jgi:hypothetical protein
MSRALYALAAVSLVVSLAPRRAEACSCVPPPPPREALASAAAVFVGKVVTVDKERDERRHVITLEVERRFKGEVADVTHLFTNRDSAACGRYFEPKERYLVYAEEANKVLVDHLCTRTTRLASAQADLEELETAARGEPPPEETRPILSEAPTEAAPPLAPVSGARSDVPAEPSRRAPGGTCKAAGAGVPLALLALFGLLGARRRR